MHHYLLNIGLNTEQPHAKLNPNYALDLLRSRGLEFSPGVHDTYHQSATERTLVLQCSAKTALTHKAWTFISLDLGQECIAVYDEDSEYGMLYGPKADKWGAFNGTVFITPGGETLDRVRDRTPSLL